jgi:hypothetical protein
MKLSELKEQVFSSGNIDNETPDGQQGIIHQVQAEAEFILAESGTPEEEADTLMSKLMAEYGQEYPAKL